MSKSLAKAALARLEKKVKDGGSEKKSDPSLRDAFKEAMQAAKSGDEDAFSEAMENAMKIHANRE